MKGKVRERYLAPNPLSGIMLSLVLALTSGAPPKIILSVSEWLRWLEVKLAHGEEQPSRR